MPPFTFAPNFILNPLFLSRVSFLPPFILIIYDISKFYIIRNFYCRLFNYFFSTFNLNETQLDFPFRLSFLPHSLRRTYVTSGALICNGGLILHVTTAEPGTACLIIPFPFRL